MDGTDIEQALADRKGAVGGDAELTGPVQVLETTPTADGGATYQVSATRLVAVDDEDPDLASVYIPVPVTAAVEVDDHDSVVGVTVPDRPIHGSRGPRLHPEPHRERRRARAVTQRPGAQGLAGPPPRSTHEITTDGGTARHPPDRVRDDVRCPGERWHRQAGRQWEKPSMTDAMQRTKVTSRDSTSTPTMRRRSTDSSGCA